MGSTQITVKYSNVACFNCSFTCSLIHSCLFALMHTVFIQFYSHNLIKVSSRESCWNCLFTSHPFPPLPSHPFAWVFATLKYVVHMLAHTHILQKLLKTFFVCIPMFKLTVNRQRTIFWAFAHLLTLIFTASAILFQNSRFFFFSFYFKFSPCEPKWNIEKASTSI